MGRITRFEIHIYFIQKSKDLRKNDTKNQDMKNSRTRVSSSLFGSTCESVSYIGEEGSGETESKYCVLGGGCLTTYSLGSDSYQDIKQENVPCKLAKLVVSRDGSLIGIANAMPKPDIVVYEAMSKRLMFTFEDHDADVTAMCFSCDSRYMASCDEARNLYIFNLTDGNIAGNIQIPPTLRISWVTSGGFEKDVKRRPTSRLLFGASGHGTALIFTFDPSLGVINLLNPSLKASRDFTCCLFSENEDTLLVGSSSGDITVIPSSKSGTWTATSSLLIPGSGGVVCLSKNGGLILAGCRDGSLCTLVVGEEHSLQLTRRIVVDKNIPVTCISTRQRNSVVDTLLGTAAGSLYHQTSLDTVRKIQQFPANPIRQVLIQNVLTSNQLISYPSGNVLLQGGGGTYTCMAISDLLGLVGTDDRIQAFDPYSGTRVWSIPSSTPTSVCLSRSIKSCLFSTLEGEIRLHDLRNRDMKLCLKEHVGRICRVQFFSDESFAISAGRDHNLITYDLRAGKQVTCHRDPHNGIVSFALFNDQTSVLTSGGKRIVFWDLRVMDPIAILDFAQEVTSVCGLEDCVENVCEFVIGDADGFVRLYDARKRLLIETNPIRHAGPVTCISAGTSKKERIVRSGGIDNTVLEWSLG